MMPALIYLFVRSHQCAQWPGVLLKVIEEPLEVEGHQGCVCARCIVGASVDKFHCDFHYKAQA